MTGQAKRNANIEARIIEDNERKEKTIILGQGAALGAEGDILIFGEITASGKLLLCDSTASDGSQTPRYALYLEGPIDTTADLTRMVIANGKINVNYCVFGGTDTIETANAAGVKHFDSLRAAGILALDYKALN